ncbi:MAG TPA: ABC-2 family transporter protein [Candidatus Dormibacteraeota bacterium]|nr:ABC-2 family transporter protein [Candidatus Dormibacteraeota bacterium]
MAAETLRLLGAGVRMNAIKILRTRGQAVANTLTDFIWHSGAMLAPILVAIRFGHIGSWPVAAVVFMLAYGAAVASVMDALSDSPFALSFRIGRGQLDHALLQPQPLWRVLFTEGFTPFDFWPVLTLGLILMAWSTAALHLAVSPGWLALLGVNLLASTGVHTAFLYAWGCIAFWAPRGAEEISSAAGNLLVEISFPLDPIPRGLRTVLVTVVPSGLLSWVPSRALLHMAGAGPLDVWLTPLAAVALGATALVLFRLGLRRYRSTGSQRYIDHGHRR